MLLRRTRNKICYHGRCGNPMIHENNRGKRFVMVRKKGGGVKRLYEGSLYYEGKECRVRKGVRRCKYKGKKKRLVLK